MGVNRTPHPRHHGRRTQRSASEVLRAAPRVVGLVAGSPRVFLHAAEQYVEPHLARRTRRHRPGSAERWGRRSPGGLRRQRRSMGRVARLDRLTSRSRSINRARTRARARPRRRRALARRRQASAAERPVSAKRSPTSAATCELDRCVVHIRALRKGRPAALFTLFR
jgi:hypothetical protein